MKLAFLLSGHLRSFEKTLPSFQMVREDLEKTYKVDVFIHTWDKLEPETKTYYDTSSIKNREVTYDDLKEYGALVSRIDKQVLINPDRNILINQSYEGLLFAEKSKYLVNQYKLYWETFYGEYDVVICSRPDIYYYSVLPKNELKDTSKVWLGHVFHNKAACDIVMYSSSQNINKVREYYNEYEDRLSDRKHSNNESYFLEYLNNKNLPLEYSNYRMPIDWKIYRSYWEDDEDNFETKQDPITWSRKYEMGK